MVVVVMVVMVKFGDDCNGSRLYVRLLVRAKGEKMKGEWERERENGDGGCNF